MQANLPVHIYRPDKIRFFKPHNLFTITECDKETVI